jgi:membrane-anchored protein YejM (alkaline phosphatase superfamily)
MMLTVSPLGCPENGHFYCYLSTLANLALIILISKMLNFLKIISSKSKKYCEGK